MKSVLIVVLSLFISCNSLKNDNGFVSRTTIFSRESQEKLGHFYPYLKLNKNKTFEYESTYICDHNIYRGNWKRTEDTLLLNVRSPSFTNLSLRYELNNFVGQDSIQTIRILNGSNDLYPYEFSTYLKINDEDYQQVLFEDGVGTYPIFEKKYIEKLTIDFPPPYSEVEIIMSGKVENSLDIILYELPEDYCIEPKTIKFLMVKDSLIYINEGKLRRNNFLIKKE